MREMKDSGVAWLGDIDSRFDIKAIGNLFTIKKDIIGREPDQVLSITQRGIKIKDTTSNEGQNAASYAHYQIVNVGDFAMNHMDLLTGWVDISRYEGVTSPDYRVFTLTDNTQIPEYFLRVFQMYYSNRVFYAFGQGAANLGRWRLPRENFVKIAIPCPPVELQRKIVDEIAAKVSKVDALIANQQAQIAKLKQYKQSLVTEIVTKGLNPGAQMRDSGLEWIGQIPQNWVVTRIKYIIDNSDFGIKCGPFGSALTGKVIDNGEILVYGQWNIVNGDFFIRRNTISKDDYESLTSYKVEPNDVLVSMMGTIGKCAIVPQDIALGIMDSHVIKIRLNTDVILPSFFQYVYDKDNSFEVFEYFTRKKKGFIMDGLNTSVIKNAYFVLPPLEEQQKMVAFLNEKCTTIQRLIEIKQDKIEKLNQYKKSLIYEYVTGKKEA